MAAVPGENPAGVGEKRAFRLRQQRGDFAQSHEGVGGLEPELRDRLLHVGKVHREIATTSGSPQKHPRFSSRHDRFGLEDRDLRRVARDHDVPRPPDGEDTGIGPTPYLLERVGIGSKRGAAVEIEAAEIVRPAQVADHRPGERFRHFPVHPGRVVLVAFGKMKRHQFRHARESRDAAATSGGEVMGRTRQLTVCLEKARLAIQYPRSPRKREEVLPVRRAVVEVRRVHELFSWLREDELDREIARPPGAAVGERHRILVAAFQQQAFQLPEPRPRRNTALAQPLGPDVQRSRLFEREGENRDSVIESPRAHAELRLFQQDVVPYLQVSERLAAFPAGGEADAPEPSSVHFPHIEHGTAIPDAIP